jgi:peptidyl-prolyl cis-trans isomerase A (cyclophilin A)
MRTLETLLKTAGCLILAGCSASSQQGHAPDVYKVNMDTSKGAVVIEVHRDWAPLGADRFYELVRSGYYDGARFFRVLPMFMAQFGIAADPQVTNKWKNSKIQDDPVKESNVKGMVTFATSGPNTRTTQMFINIADNVRLDGLGFAPIGKVISGIEAVESFYMGYGEGAPRGQGPQQGLIEQQGNKYLEKEFPQLDYIKKATVQ